MTLGFPESIPDELTLFGHGDKLVGLDYLAQADWAAAVGDIEDGAETLRNVARQEGQYHGK